MLVVALEVEYPLAGVLFDREVICSYPSKRFHPPSPRNPSSARRIRRPVLDHDHATRVGQKNILMIYISDTLTLNSLSSL
jgi:hypothetical protein